MIVPKKEMDSNRKKFRKFKKLSLQLYQKNYHLHSNEFVILNRPSKTNTQLITTIEEKLRVPQADFEATKGIKAQVRRNADAKPASLLKTYDFNYHHSLNLPIHTNFTLHLNSSLQSKNDFGFYAVSPAISYHNLESYYRFGFTWGPRADFYLMATKKINENTYKEIENPQSRTTGILVSFAQQKKFSKDKFIASIRYRSLWGLTIHWALNFFLLGAKSGNSQLIPMQKEYQLFIPQLGYGEKGFIGNISRTINSDQSLKLDLTFTEWLWSLRSGLQLRLNDFIKVLFNFEVQNRSCFFSIGQRSLFSQTFSLKLKQFYLGVPLVDVTSYYQIITGIIGISMIAMKWERIKAWVDKSTSGKKESNVIEDKLLKRQQDLKLISRRVKEIYNDEIKKNGLLIREAYYGSSKSITEIKDLSPHERMRVLAGDRYEDKIIEVTDSVRFYVDDSKLLFTNKSKTGLYGFYAPNLEPDDKLVLYIIYSYKGQDKEIEINDTEDLRLPQANSD